jgi:tetratricopeptide (TPR) repeat protein
MLALALATAILAGPSAQPGSAEEHARRADAMLEAGRLEDAEYELLLAYADDPNLYYLYGLGVLARLQGDCATAIERFERVRELLPTSGLEPPARDQTAADAEVEIVRCRGEALGPTPPPEPPVAEASAPVEAEPRPSAPLATDPRSSVERPWYRDPLGGALLGTGSIATAVGIGLLVGAAVTDANAERAAAASIFVEETRRARMLGTAGIAALGAGGVVLAAAILRYALLRRRDGRVLAFGRLGPPWWPPGVLTARSRPAARSRSGPR